MSDSKFNPLSGLVCPNFVSVVPSGLENSSTSYDLAPLQLSLNQLAVSIFTLYNLLYTCTCTWLYTTFELTSSHIVSHYVSRNYILYTVDWSDRYECVNSIIRAPLRYILWCIFTVRPGSNKTTLTVCLIINLRVCTQGTLFHCFMVPDELNQAHWGFDPGLVPVKRGCEVCSVPQYSTLFQKGSRKTSTWSQESVGLIKRHSAPEWGRRTWTKTCSWIESIECLRMMWMASVSWFSSLYS